MKKKFVSLLLASALGLSVAIPSTGKLLMAAAEELFTVNYAEYIPEHTLEFVSDFNSEVLKDVEEGEEVDETALLKASSVEFTCQIYNLAKKGYDTYLDFDGENGYMLIGEDNIMYDFSTTGDLAYLREYNGDIFFDYSGYCYYDEKEGYVLFSQDESVLNNREYYYYDELEGYVLVPQDQDLLEGRDYYYYDEEKGYTLIPQDVLLEEALSGSSRPNFKDGYITDSNILQHRNLVYSDIVNSSSGYTVNSIREENNDLENPFTYYDQFLTSVYYSKSEAGYTSEGNCMPHSTWQILNYWALYKDTVLPSYEQVNYSIQGAVTYCTYSSDIAYSKLGKTGYTLLDIDDIDIMMYSRVNEKQFLLPTLYSWIRDYLMTKSHYVITGATIFNSTVIKAVKYATSQVGYKNTSVNSISKIYTNVLSEIENDYPLWIVVLGDDYYHDHGMAITGMKIYNINYTQGNLQGLRSIAYLRVADGHDREFRWYDLPALTSLGSSYNRCNSATVYKVRVSS